MLQQNVGGSPVAMYRFPPRLRFTANTVVTVWSGTHDLLLHQPPTDFVFQEQHKWGTGPECTTILCKPNGQVSRALPSKCIILNKYWIVASLIYKYTILCKPNR